MEQYEDVGRVVEHGYGHIGAQAKHDAVATLDRPQKREEPAVSTTEPPEESRDTGRTIN